MKVGDLVRIKNWCKNKGKLAIVAELSPFSRGEVKIQIIAQGYKEIWARSTNLEPVKSRDNN